MTSQSASGVLAVIPDIGHRICVRLREIIVGDTTALFLVSFTWREERKRLHGADKGDGRAGRVRGYAVFDVWLLDAV